MPHEHMKVEGNRHVAKGISHLRLLDRGNVAVSPRAACGNGLGNSGTWAGPANVPLEAIYHRTDRAAGDRMLVADSGFSPALAGA